MGFSYHVCSEFAFLGRNKAAVEAGVFPYRTIYEKLASAFTEEQAVLYNQRVEEISPNIRYCAYNIGERAQRWHCCWPGTSRGHAGADP